MGRFSDLTPAFAAEGIHSEDVVDAHLDAVTGHLTVALSRADLVQTLTPAQMGGRRLSSTLAGVLAGLDFEQEEALADAAFDAAFDTAMAAAESAATFGASAEDVDAPQVSPSLSLAANMGTFGATATGQIGFAFGGSFVGAVGGRGPAGTGMNHGAALDQNDVDAYSGSAPGSAPAGPAGSGGVGGPPGGPGGEAGAGGQAP